MGLGDGVGWMGLGGWRTSAHTRDPRQTTLKSGYAALESLQLDLQLAGAGGAGVAASTLCGEQAMQILEPSLWRGSRWLVGRACNCIDDNSRGAGTPIPPIPTPNQYWHAPAALSSASRRAVWLPSAACRKVQLSVSWRGGGAM